LADWSTKRVGVSPLTPSRVSVNCSFADMWNAPIVGVTEETERDFAYPQHEAAFFYGLFLRGHSAEELRRDIEVPPQVLARWHREAEREPGLRCTLERIVEYRRHVLAIFDSLITCDTRTTFVQ
jgi:hypothetical protein